MLFHASQLSVCAPTEALTVSLGEHRAGDPQSRRGSADCGRLITAYFSICFSCNGQMNTVVGPHFWIASESDNCGSFPGTPQDLADFFPTFPPQDTSGVTCQSEHRAPKQHA